MNKRIKNGGFTKLIVGIDPGIKTAVAILSIDGKLISVLSKRYFSISEISDCIVKYGEPIVVATDTYRAPKLVKRISSSFGAKLVTQKKLTVFEKERISKNVKVMYKNHHERDAIVAAYLARKKFSRLFEKIDKKLKKKGLQHLSEDVKALLVKRRVTIERAIELVK